jgi:hypothetical protein
LEASPGREFAKSHLNNSLSSQAIQKPEIGKIITPKYPAKKKKKKKKR